LGGRGSYGGEGKGIEVFSFLGELKKTMTRGGDDPVTPGRDLRDWRKKQGEWC